MDFVVDKSDIDIIKNIEDATANLDSESINGEFNEIKNESKHDGSEESIGGSANTKSKTIKSNKVETEIEHDKTFYVRKINEKNVYKDAMFKAFGIVKNYVARNKLILVGGMSIDLVLKSKNRSLYSEEELPDYDFLSPTFHIDAYEICAELKAVGMTEVQAINALHASTMRVKINLNNTVADITYIPKNIYDRLPYIEWQGLRIIHPHYQLIDQHISLSHPYMNPPRENILSGRWKKDMTRHDLIISVFPFPHSLELTSKHAVNLTEDNKASIKKFLSTSNVHKPKMHELHLSLVKNECIGGFPALAYWINKAIENGFKIESNTKFSIKNKKIICEVPYGMPFTMYSDNVYQLSDAIIADKKPSKFQKEYWNSILEKTPRKILLIKEGKVGGGEDEDENEDESKNENEDEDNKSEEDEESMDEDEEFKGGKSKEKTNSKHVEPKSEYELFDNYGEMVSAYYDPNIKELCVANLQLIQCHMLTEWVINNSVAHLDGYIKSRELVKWASANYADNKSLYEIFLPTTIVYGKYNLSHSYVVAKHAFYNAMNRIQEKKSLPDKLFERDINGKMIEKKSKFKPEESPEYQFDGMKTTKFEQITLPVLAGKFFNDKIDGGAIIEEFLFYDD
jgi:hypothetical protein